MLGIGAASKTGILFIGVVFFLHDHHWQAIWTIWSFQHDLIWYISYLFHNCTFHTVWQCILFNSDWSIGGQFYVMFWQSGLFLYVGKRFSKLQKNTYLLLFVRHSNSNIYLLIIRWTATDGVSTSSSTTSLSSGFSKSMSSTAPAKLCQVMSVRIPWSSSTRSL